MECALSLDLRGPILVGSTDLYRCVEEPTPEGEAEIEEKG